MALRVWLPLNGTLENKGISDLVFSNDNTTNIVIDNNGKIGKCYSRTTKKTAGRIISDKNINLNGDISICCWAYVSDCVGDTANGLVSIHSYSNNTGIGITIKQISTSDYRISCNTGYGSGRTYCTYYGTTNIKNAWHHLTITYSKLKAQLLLYVDGNLEYTLNNYNNASKDDKIIIFDWSTSYNGPAYRPASKLNDVRIYDHALSAKEVKEISQGLVLHYKLDGILQNSFSEGDNLIPNSIEMNLDSSDQANGVWRYAGSNSMFKSRVLIGDSPIGSCYGFQNSGIQTPNDGSCYGIDSTTYFKPNTEYRISMYARLISGQNAQAGFNIYNISSELGGSHNGTIIKYYRATELPQDGSWVYCWYHFKTNDATTRNIYIGITTGDTDVVTQMCLVHIEEWQEWMDNIQIKDSSGYGNDGTIVGTLTTITNSPKYNNGFNIPLSTTISHIRCLSNVDQEWTCAAWVKPTTAGNYQNLNNFNVCNRLYHGTYPLLYLNSGTNDYYNYGNFALPANQWTHIAFVFKNTTGTKLIYINGEEHTNKNGPNKTSLPAGIPNTVKIGGSYEGGLCDYREYATALSAEDIADLYHTPASIDNLGNAHAFELVEQETNIFKKENIEKYNTKNKDIGIGEWVLRNGEWSINIRPEPFYKNNYNASVESGMLMDEFLPNTQYIFDMWIDSDDVIYNGNYVGGGFYIHYTDNTRESCVQIGGNGKGFQHFVIISNKNKSISHLVIYYYTRANVYYRWDSIIKPYSTTSFSKEGINYSYLIENNDKFSIENGGCVKSVGYIEK